LELRDKLSALHRSGQINIILNLKYVTGIDSAGLGTLVFGLARLRKAGGKLALLNVNRTHLKLFLLTRLAIAFDFFDDEQEAVNSFFPGRALKHFDVLDFVEHEDGQQFEFRRRCPGPAKIGSSAATSHGYGPDPHRRR
jgi:anti-sigma B factor antagonist